MLKDMIGREVKVGDVLAWSGTYSGVSINMVTKILPKTVRVCSGDLVYPKCSVIINEQLETTNIGDTLLTTLADRCKDRLDHTPPKR